MKKLIIWVYLVGIVLLFNACSSAYVNILLTYRETPRNTATKTPND